MDPNAIYDSEREHDHERERTGVTDERQGHTCDRQDRDRHANVLENVREDERADSHDEKQPKLIASKKGNEQTGEQK